MFALHGDASVHKWIIWCLPLLLRHREYIPCGLPKHGRQQRYCTRSSLSLGERLTWCANTGGVDEQCLVNWILVMYRWGHTCHHRMICTGNPSSWVAEQHWTQNSTLKVGSQTATATTGIVAKRAIMTLSRCEVMFPKAAHILEWVHMCLYHFTLGESYVSWLGRQIDRSMVQILGNTCNWSLWLQGCAVKLCLQILASLF